MNSTPPTASRWWPAQTQAPAWSVHQSGSLCQRTVSHGLNSSSRYSSIRPTKLSQYVAHLRSPWKYVKPLASFWLCVGPVSVQLQLPTSGAHVAVSCSNSWMLELDVYQQSKDFNFNLPPISLSSLLQWGGGVLLKIKKLFVSLFLLLTQN